MSSEVAAPRFPERPLRTAAAGMRWYFCFFFVSGFCSILYELIWLRLAMAQFGVTTATVSMVLSSFMAGLGVGSWLAGVLARGLARRFRQPPLRLYALTEILIGCAAIFVPLELLAGRWVLEHIGSSLELSSAGYYLVAGAWLAATLVPWCACMGATIPLGMSAIREAGQIESQRSFSFLYLANVCGAVIGALLPLLIIEVFGFNGTLRFAMLLNLCVGAAALRLTRGQTLPRADAGDAEGDAVAAVRSAMPRHAAGMPGAERRLFGNAALWLLFCTGFTSMGMEVVWTRQFTIFVGTFVYSFAAILAVYLGATFIGSKLYRVWSHRHDRAGSLLWLLIWLAALLPLASADPRLGIPAWLRVPLGIGAFSALLGFLTPQLIDRHAQGDARRAGMGYAVNVAGCILGPLCAGFLLLPWLDERVALTLLASPWLLVAVSGGLKARATVHAHRAGMAIAVAVLLALSLVLIALTRSYVQDVPSAQVRRDSTATVVATGSDMGKHLLVNGVGMTALTPITKMMSALPLAFLDRPPRDALVICFGMGTTHRSMLSWGIDSTVVELVPSVPELFWYFHADAARLLDSPRSHVVIDDGRRFLERSSGQYDVIVIDPPPPIEAAGSSLLYSREFYAAALKRLRPDGILQQWYPGGGDRETTVAVARAINESFPHVRVFPSVTGWGIHFLASRRRIPDLTAAELSRRLPPAAAADLVEWGPFATPEQQFAAVVEREMPIDAVIAMDSHVPAMQDDRPINEYYLLRRLAHGTAP